KHQGPRAHYHRTSGHPTTDPLADRAPRLWGDRGPRTARQLPRPILATDTHPQPGRACTPRNADSPMSTAETAAGRPAPHAATSNVRPLPTGFTLGSATASYQVEGAARADRRGPTIGDPLSQTP